MEFHPSIYDASEDKYFSVESFTNGLPRLRKDLKAIDMTEEGRQLVESLTDSDFLDIYATWRYIRMPKDPAIQDSLVFETLGKRYADSLEPSSEIEAKISDLLLLIWQDKYSQILWGHPVKNPDDIKINIRENIEIAKIYECKISGKAVHSGSGLAQRRGIIEQTYRLLSAFNEGGNIQEDSKNTFAEIRDKLKSYSDKPIKIAEDCKFVYILPLDQPFNSRDSNVQTIYAPLRTTEISQIRTKILTYFGYQ